MKILFLTDNFPPEVNAPASRTFDHCREWARAGHEITVITCQPNFPQGKIYPGYQNRWRTEEMLDSIRVIRVWSYIASNEGFGRRILDYLSFMATGFWASLFIKTDLIVATSPQFFAAFSGILAHFFKKRPWIMEVRDLWPESIRAVGAMRGENFAFRFLEKMELFLYRKAARIVVVTDAFQENLVRRGVPSDKIFVVKNGVMLDQFLPVPKDENLLDELGLRGKFVVGYFGTHGMAHGLDFILRCAKKLENEPIHFLFIGDGAEKGRLLDLKNELNLANATFLPPVAKAEIGRWISLTDVALVPLKKSDTFKTVLPSKIFENAAMQKPVLLGVEGEAQKLVEAFSAGLCFEPENEVDFLKKLRNLADDRELYENLQAGCSRLAAEFDRQKLAVQMLEILKNTVSIKK